MASSQGQTSDEHLAEAVGCMDLTSSLEDLQTDEQRRVLDTVAQVRKCGLESILSLPQLVVCGDQSAGKSSVLEALTEIPFPRGDNLCTRFATEIILRRANTNSLTIKIIPDPKRPADEQAPLKAFQESITNFTEFPRIMDAAKSIMDVDRNTAPGANSRAFARDVLSIEIEGPSRPQLTLVDIPGLIATDTKGLTKADVELVGEITDQYISLPRTICLAVVSAANDHANQKILTKVREVDPEGDRTLGIITKPDRLPSGSGSEKAFLDLARNEDINFKLGWHVLKNRTFEERDSSLMERKAAEDTYFRTSNFKCLLEDCVGIDALRLRLSRLLFEHVSQELPKLRTDLESAFVAAESQLVKLGNCRTSATECKIYLTQLSQSYYEICKAAVDGQYEGSFFNSGSDLTFDITSSASPTTSRLRAMIQYKNHGFSKRIRIHGHKYQIDVSDSTVPQLTIGTLVTLEKRSRQTILPVSMNKEKAREWVYAALVRTRGRELVGNFNPLLIGELFWEQSSKWRHLAVNYLHEVAEVCERFLDILLQDICPKDILSRLQSSLIRDKLATRYNDASQELERILEDLRSYRINYNHYYTDTIRKLREGRQRAYLSKGIEKATTRKNVVGIDSKNYYSSSVDVDKAMLEYSRSTDPDMENVSCEEALDWLLAIYKVI